MPSQSPLPFAKKIDDLSELLNDQELSFGHRVLSLFARAGSVPADCYNLVTFEYDLLARFDKRLKAVAVPAGATTSDVDQAMTTGASQAVRDAFLAFVSPLMREAEILCRADAYLDAIKLDVLVLREADPYVPAVLGGYELPSGEGWSWKAEAIGDDIVVQEAKTTAFGGGNDQGDSGETACGFPTKGHPDLLGCALPLGGYAHSAAEHKALDGTPLPHMEFGLTSKGADRPAGSHVEVIDPKSGVTVILPVIDLGPARATGHALDLTVAAARLFKSNATANNFSMVLNYRLINGALSLPPEVRKSALAASTTAGSTIASAGTINQKIYAAAAKNDGVLDSRKIPYTENGVLGCAWAVNEVVRQALGHPIGGGLSTEGLYNALKKGRGTVAGGNDIPPGTIVVSPAKGDTHGHAGILGEGSLIYSNRSNTGIFTPYYTMDSWKAYFEGTKKLQTWFYNVAS